MIKIVNGNNKDGSEFKVKVFQDSRFSDLAILLPMEYMIYAKNSDGDMQWISNDDLSYELIESITTETIMVINKNTLPIDLILFDYHDKKHDLELLKYAAHACQFISFGITPDKRMINAEYGCINTHKYKMDNLYLCDYYNLIDEDFDEYDMGYEEI